MPAVHQLRPNQSERPADIMPAIRTPDQYREAKARVSELLEDLKGKPIDAYINRITEAGTVLGAMDASPFIVVDDKIVARGFRPQIIR